MLPVELQHETKTDTGTKMILKLKAIMNSIPRSYIFQLSNVLLQMDLKLLVIIVVCPCN